ncbi:MAG: hypothetical protein M0P64_00160 [Candidatus Pacebacteria bacterium]|nr:hypothetical protein [Candidatus Paceibacterota bacterium]
MNRFGKFLLSLVLVIALILVAVTYAPSTKAMVLIIIAGTILLASAAAWMDVAMALKKERDRPY